MEASSSVAIHFVQHLGNWGNGRLNLKGIDGRSLEDSTDHVQTQVLNTTHLLLLPLGPTPPYCRSINEDGANAGNVEPSHVALVKTTNSVSKHAHGHGSLARFRTGLGHMSTVR